MAWLFRALSPWLDWTFAIIGVVAFLMSVHPFTHAIWGRPKIKIIFGDGDIEGVPYLDFAIINEPIVRGPLAWIGVQRDGAGEIVARIEVKEDGTHRVVVPGFFPVLAGRGTGQGAATRVPLPASVMGVSAIIVHRDPETNGVLVGEQAKRQPFPPGQYIVTITVMGQGKPSRGQRRFAVDSDHTFRWLAN